MAEVTLKRVTLPGKKNQDYTVVVNFTDLDGNKVSLNFDGRYGNTIRIGDYNQYYYAPNPMYPVINGHGEYLKDLDNLQIIRNLRDSLNDLNLGE